MKRRRNGSLLTAFALAGALAVPPGCGNSTNGGGNEGTALSIQALLFIKRQHTTVTKHPDGSQTVTVDVAGGNGQVLDYQRYVPGGSLNLLSPARADGTVTNLTADFPEADFNGADVSFDGKQAVFSMKRDPTDNYHIYTAQLAAGADGKFELHQKTGGAWDDISPIYIPGGQIVFVTNQMYTAMGTRADEYEHAREALQLASISVDGGDADRHLFAQNLSHSVTPFLRHDGRIGFSQWEHFAAVNDVKLRVVNPDGTQQLAIAGQHSKPVNALFTVKEISPNVMIGIGTTRNRTIHAGTLLKIDARNHNDRVCLDDSAYQNHQTDGHACLDEENATFEILTPDVPTGNGPSAVGRYREPSILPDGRILVSWAAGAVSDINEQALTAPDFGVYVYDTRTGKNQLVYNDRNTWDLNALAVAPRAEPPAIPNLQHTQDSTVAAHIGSVDVSQTSLDETVDGAQFAGTPLSQALRDEAVAVRVIEGFSSEGTPGAPMFGLTMFEGAAVLGEAPVYQDRSWLADVPAYLPLHLQPIDKFGLAIRNQQLWIQGMPGETRRCVGCHESRTGQGVPVYGQNPTVAEQQGARAFTQAIADRVEFPWDKKVQPILDAKCATCHNSTTTDYYFMTRTDPVNGLSTTYKIPTLDLTSTPVTVYYDKRVASWPASYVSIFYAAALEMGDNGMAKVTITGSTPAVAARLLAGDFKWGIPGSARASKLTRKLNLRAPDGTTTAWTTPLHPEDKQVQLSDDERKTIAVYPMDLGGQFYARQNTAFVPFAYGDPVTPAH
jgi:Hydrazine synthase alpha subunit middle domain